MLSLLPSQRQPHAPHCSTARLQRRAAYPRITPSPTSIPPHLATTGSSHARSSAPTVDTVRVSLLGATILSLLNCCLFYRLLCRSLLPASLLFCARDVLQEAL